MFGIKVLANHVNEKTMLSTPTTEQMHGIKERLNVSLKRWTKFPKKLVRLNEPKLGQWGVSNEIDSQIEWSWKDNSPICPKYVQNKNWGYIKWH